MFCSFLLDTLPVWLSSFNCAPDCAHHLMPQECQIEVDNGVLCFLCEAPLHTVQNVVGFFSSSLQCWLIHSVTASMCKIFFSFFFPVCCLDSFTFCFSTLSIGNNNTHVYWMLLLLVQDKFPSCPSGPFTNGCHGQILVILSHKSGMQVWLCTVPCDTVL